MPNHSLVSKTEQRDVALPEPDDLFTHEQVCTLNEAAREAHVCAAKASEQATIAADLLASAVLAIAPEQGHLRRQATARLSHALVESRGWKQSTFYATMQHGFDRSEVRALMGTCEAYLALSREHAQLLHGLPAPERNKWAKIAIRQDLSVPEFQARLVNDGVIPAPAEPSKLVVAESKDLFAVRKKDIAEMGAKDRKALREALDEAERRLALVRRWLGA